MQDDGERTSNRYTDLYMLYKIASYYYHYYLDSLKAGGKSKHFNKNIN